MSERYERLFYITEHDQPIESSAPIKFKAGALLLDKQQHKVIAQLKFENISHKSIKSMIIDIYAFDKIGTKLESVLDFEYSNLIAKPKDTFGDKYPILMKDNNTCYFEVDIVSIQFSDGTSWSRNGEAITNVTKQTADVTVKVVKQTADVTTKVTKKVLPFIVNTIVFLCLLLITLGLALLGLETTFDVIVTGGFALMTLISFPAFGLLLEKKTNGKKFRVARWGIIFLILIMLFVLGRTVF